MSLPREYRSQATRGTFDEKFQSSAFSIHDSSKSSIKQCEQMPSVPPDVAVFNEFNTTGSLCSIHSAPQVQIVDSINVNSEIVAGQGDGNGQWQQNLSTKSVFLELIGNKRTSEIDEDDNDNLLTVSSVTARPLIAKSRELRCGKFSNRLNRRKEISSDNDTTTPLDGGYGWCVVFGAFSVQFWVAGLVKSYGVLFVEILEIFPTNTTAVASWIPAILSALCLALAPLSSALCQRFSCRTVVFIGGLFCACGLMLSYFATSLYHLLFTFGILTGIGGGLSTTPGIIIVSLYFNKRRALANGICVSGTAAGSFVFPILIECLIHKFGFHGTLLLLGAGMLHVCVSASLYRPLDTNCSESVKSTKCENSSNSTATNLTLLTSTNGDAKRYIEHLFMMEESKNRLNDLYNTNKLGALNDNNGNTNEGDDEYTDTMGESKFTKFRPISAIRPTRSSSILHSVEDLSTDSTCVYKARSGYDSNRGSRRRITTQKFGNRLSNDEIPDKQTLNSLFDQNTMSTIQASNNRGLSKSMILPTPVSDLSESDDIRELKRPKTLCEKIQRYIDVTLLKDATFIGMCLSVTLMSVGCPYMLYFLPAYAISAGFTKKEAGLLVAISAVLDLVGRLGFGYLSDLQIFDRKKAFIVCILGAGLAVLSIPFENHSYLVGFSSATYGLCLGCWYLLVPVLLADLFGTERISSSYGLVRMFQSVGAISVPPLAGYLKDLTGGYDTCFYCMGACMVLGAVPLIVLTVLEPSSDTTPNSDESDVSTVSN
ncbi:monocarboxylate transporter 12 isoform X2 [Contarinia nasturtii]|uniref:monocarboxylate transporter 12 isoform X2 n=1 Tax=Contarinia nasturtii TaxID=265458 RepID=UPI0012D3DFDA|nr:monocarboxylate transporter 12 isoform X2 [Contarinia nasturtii]